MKKSNWIILAVVVVASAFLLWLWYFLAFNKVDNPLDLVLSIIWWVIVAIAVFAIWKVEEARRKRIRTIYVGPKSIFNAEAGMVPYIDSVNLVEETERVLNDLKYSFDRKDLPEDDDFDIAFIIRTDTYKDQEETDSSQKAQDPNTAATTVAATPENGKDRVWKGEVVFALTKEERPFEDKSQLVRILNAV